MILVLILTVAVASGVSCENSAPIYSRSYANVYYQRAPAGEAPRYSVKSNLPAQQEGTTPHTEIFTNFDELNPTNDPDTTTDPNSEKIDTRRDKYTPTKYSEQLELTEEFEPTVEPEQEEEEPIIKHQGVYYIYHPNGLLQQVVFETRDDPIHKKYFAQVNYQDIPAVYAYDGDHLVFQQLNRK